MSAPGSPPRGALHVYLGPVPGVGKTYRMLAEGRRLADLGVDVVVGWVETHGRQDNGALAQFGEHVPPHPVVYRNAIFDEMDLDALVERRPDVALVDELAHGNVPGMRHEKRCAARRPTTAGGRRSGVLSGIDWDRPGPLLQRFEPDGSAGPHRSVVRDPELRSFLGVLSFRKGTGPRLRP